MSYAIVVLIRFTCDRCNVDAEVEQIGGMSAGDALEGIRWNEIDGDHYCPPCAMEVYAEQC